MRTKSRATHHEPPADLEEVKRNLIRQNRNLARANSTQSLQIRTLSAEVSRLLSVNLSLKENIISLRGQLHDVRRQKGADGANQFHRAMATHLREMTAMLNAIQDQTDPTQSPQPSPETRKSMCLEGMEFRERPTMKEMMASTRMPTIKENRIYPRLPAPLLELSPVRRVEDKVAADLPLPASSPVVNKVEGAAAESADDQVDLSGIGGDVPACDSHNVETRRRRKLSSSGALSRRRSSFISPLADSDASTILKTGAKRKLSDRDSSSQDSRSPNKQIFVLDEQERSVPASVPVRMPRNMLSEKSANFSPQKLRRVDQDMKASKPEKQDMPVTRKQDNPAVPAKTPHSRGRPADGKWAAEAVASSEDDAVEIVLPPITPYQADILSPLSSDGSLRDTPPPAELSMRTTSSNEAARPSRRARAAVNYAEPNLVSKMRRPSKAMVDALTGLQDPRRAVGSTDRRESSIPPSETPSASIDPDHAPSNAKRQSRVAEHADEVGETTAKPVDVSKLDGNADCNKEKQRSKATYSPRRNNSLGLSSKMLIAREQEDSAVAKQTLDLAIFDFDDSSSSTSSPPQADPLPSSKAIRRASRRHSSAL